MQPQQMNFLSQQQPPADFQQPQKQQQVVSQSNSLFSKANKKSKMNDNLSTQLYQGTKMNSNAWASKK